MPTQRYGFRCLYHSRIAGPFLGYAPSAIHRLDDGTVWRQVSDRTEHVDAERPEAWVYTDGTDCYLDVEGAGGVVQVSRCVDPMASGSTEQAPSWPPRT